MIASFMLSVILSSCNADSKKDVQDAQGNIAAANKNLEKAVVDANADEKARVKADWQQFKRKSDVGITAIKKDVEVLKVKTDNRVAKNKVKINADLAAIDTKLANQKVKLNQQNIAFEADLKTFTKEVTARNEAFEKRFDYEMDTLRRDVKKLF